MIGADELLVARVELLEADLEAWHRRCLEAEAALVGLGLQLAQAEAERDEVGNHLTAARKTISALYGR